MLQMAILVLFEQFLSKCYLNILPLFLRGLSNIQVMMHFLRTFSFCVLTP